MTDVIDPNKLTPLTDKQLTVLMQDLKPHRVLKRSQGGASLSYLATYDVKAMLIRVFGFGGFSSEVLETKILDVERYEKNGKPQVRIAALCTVRLAIHQTGAVYTESAVAGQSGAVFGDVADFAVKTAESDALKRAAINLGTQFGLSLYQNGSLSDVVMAVVAPGQERTPSVGLTEQQQADAATSIGFTPHEQAPVQDTP